MSTRDNNSDWNKWSLYIIKTIELLQSRIDNLEEEIKNINLQIQKEITEIKTGSKFATAIASIIVSLIISIASGYTVYVITTNSQQAEITEIRK